MKLRKWFELRGPGFVYRRGSALFERYGLTPSIGANRVSRLTEVLAGLGCAATYPTPGHIVDRYAHFIRGLQEAGAEIAVHGYDHVDLSAYPPRVAGERLAKAAEAFRREGIEVHGFRCPYLACSDELLDALPKGLFGYSSNRAIWFDTAPQTMGPAYKGVEEGVRSFYRSEGAAHALSLPQTRFGTLEIPVCVPDDLQLHDVFGLDAEGVAGVWAELLTALHRRGELLVLLTHPELASICEPALVDLLRAARRLHPVVWIARLRDIKSWWREKEQFSCATSPTLNGLHISFDCTHRATILVRGLDQSPRPAWDGRYHQLEGRELDCPAEPRPFIGLQASAPAGVASLLRDQGYILETGAEATRCGLYLDAATLAGIHNGVELVNHVEASEAPLVRYWRWPEAAKSALCVTADLDALCLVDYASRFLVR